MSNNISRYPGKPGTQFRPKRCRKIWTVIYEFTEPGLSGEPELMWLCSSPVPWSNKILEHKVFSMNSDGEIYWHV